MCCLFKYQKFNIKLYFFIINNNINLYKLIFKKNNILKKIIIIKNNKIYYNKYIYKYKYKK